MTKKQLAIALSKLASFRNPKTRLEQYSTDSEIAACVLWHAWLKGDMEEKVVVDLGCGTGILGIGALLLGAKHVHFVDKDKDALQQCEENLQDYDFENVTFHHMDVEQFQGEADTVIQNPPFGTKNEHADKVFLEKAFSLASRVYSFHKTSTDVFIQAIAKDHRFVIEEPMKLLYPLKRTMKFHKKKIQRIDVTCYILHKTHEEDTTAQ